MILKRTGGGEHLHYIYQLKKSLDLTPRSCSGSSQWMSSWRTYDVRRFSGQKSCDLQVLGFLEILEELGGGASPSKLVSGQNKIK